VSAEHPHSKLIAAAARKALRPLGVVRKGRSRTWLDDNGWWVCVIEFQPSSYSRGSYLNVGAHFLWRPRGHLSFDFGHRVELGNHGRSNDYVEYESDQQFAPLADLLARRAAERLAELRQLFSSFDAASSALSDEPGFIARIDAGIAFGLIGNSEAARAQFAQYLDRPASEYSTTADDKLRERTEHLWELVADPVAFRKRIAADVKDERSAKRLPPDESAL
jgi:hypothetical protein